MDSIQDENQVPPEPPEEAAQPQEAEAQQAPAAPEPKEAPRRPRAEEALAAMRADLREQESQELAGGRGLKGLMRRIFRRRRAKPPEVTEEPPGLEELKFPEPPAARLAPPPEAAVEQAGAPVEPEAAPPVEEAKPDFQSLVRNRLGGAFSETIQREPLEMEPPAPVEDEEADPPGPTHSILTTLRQEEEEAPLPEPVDFRQAALEDYVVATEEPEEEPGPALTRRMKRSWRYMRPADRGLLVGALVLVGLFMLGGAGYAVIKSAPTPTAAVTPTPRIDPIPISITLPGGLAPTPLSIGYVTNGKWNPARPEWLDGTIVCRWVSLPWTVQLEAVLRTFKANDEIQLTMSDYSSIVFKVYSIQQVASADIGKLCPEGPSLLLMLSQEGTDDRWVVTAKP